MVYRRPVRATATTSAPEDIAADRDDAPDVVSAAMVPFAWRFGRVRSARSLAAWQCLPRGILVALNMLRCGFQR